LDNAVDFWLRNSDVVLSAKKCELKTAIVREQIIDTPPPVALRIPVLEASEGFRLNKEDA
jgi:hypothetical protein